MGHITITQKPKAQDEYYFPNKLGFIQEFSTSVCTEPWDCINDALDSVNYDKYVYSSSPSLKSTLFKVDVTTKEWTRINYVEFGYILKSHLESVAWDAEIKSIVSHSDYPEQGAEISEDNFKITTGYRTYKTFYFTNPFTSDTWDWLDFEDIQIGLQASSPSVTLFKYKFIPIANGDIDVEGVYPEISEHFEVVQQSKRTSFVYESRPTYYTETFYVDLDTDEWNTYFSSCTPSGEWSLPTFSCDGDEDTYTSPTTSTTQSLILSKPLGDFEQSNLNRIDSVRLRVKYKAKDVAPAYDLWNIHDTTKLDDYNYMVAITDEDYLYVGTNLEDYSGVDRWKFLKVDKVTKTVISEVDVPFESTYQKSVGDYQPNLLTSIEQNTTHVFFSDMRGNIAKVSKDTWVIIANVNPTSSEGAVIRTMRYFHPEFYDPDEGELFVLLENDSRIITINTDTMLLTNSRVSGISDFRFGDFCLSVNSNTPSGASVTLYLPACYTVSIAPWYVYEITKTYSPGSDSLGSFQQTYCHNEFTENNWVGKIVKRGSSLYFEVVIHNTSLRIYRVSTSGFWEARTGTISCQNESFTDARMVHTSKLIIGTENLFYVRNHTLENTSTSGQLGNLTIRMYAFTTLGSSGLQEFDYPGFVYSGGGSDGYRPVVFIPYIQSQAGISKLMLGGRGWNYYQSTPTENGRIILGGDAEAEGGLVLTPKTFYQGSLGIFSSNDIVASGTPLSEVSSDGEWSEWIDISTANPIGHSMPFVSWNQTMLENLSVQLSSFNIEISKVELDVASDFVSGDIISVTLNGRLGTVFGEEIANGAYFYLQHPTAGSSGSVDDAFTIKNPSKPFTKRVTTLPNTSDHWTLDDVKNTKFGVRMKGGSEARLEYFYVTVETEKPFHPEIRCANMYVKVNHTPEDVSCELNSPETVSFNHSRNTNMINFWSGNRSVYDHSRSGKSLVLMGKEFNRDIIGCRKERDCSYYEKHACDRLQCIDTMGRDGEPIEIDGFSFTPWNKSYRILSFGYRIIQQHPKMFEYLLELEEYNPSEEESR